MGCAQHIADYTTPEGKSCYTATATAQTWDLSDACIGPQGAQINDFLYMCVGAGTMCPNSTCADHVSPATVRPAAEAPECSKYRRGACLAEPHCRWDGACFPALPPPTPPAPRTACQADKACIWQDNMCISSLADAQQCHASCAANLSGFMSQPPVQAMVKPGGACDQACAEVGPYNRRRQPQTTPQTTNSCTCENGTAATGAACTTDGAELCATCNNGFTLDRTACTVNICTCKNGMAATGAACTTDGAEGCATCNNGFTLDSTANKCTATDEPQTTPLTASQILTNERFDINPLQFRN